MGHTNCVPLNWPLDLWGGDAPQVMHAALNVRCAWSSGAAGVHSADIPCRPGLLRSTPEYRQACTGVARIWPGPQVSIPVITGSLLIVTIIVIISFSFMWLRFGVAENGVLHVFKVYWRQKLIVKITQLF